jgi:hypothetical protein
MYILTNLHQKSGHGAVPPFRLVVLVIRPPEDGRSHDVPWSAVRGLVSYCLALC